MANCILTGTIVLGNDEAVPYAYIHATPYDSPALLQGTDKVVSPEVVTTVTTSTGEFELELVRNMNFTVNIPLIGFKKTIRVPDSATASLWSLSDIFVSGDPTPTDNNEDNW